MSKKNPWSHKIDYVKAIANDEADIAQLSDPVLVGLCQSLTESEITSYKRGYRITVIDLLFNEAKREERLAIIGLTSAQAAQAVLCYSDGSPNAIEYDRLAAIIDPAVEFKCGLWYREGSAVTAKLCDYQIMPEGQRLDWLKKAKASLARHKRNRAKYGA